MTWWFWQNRPLLNFFFSFFCTEWISASTQSRVQFYNQEEEFVESDIKLQLGFFSANITLKATDEIQFPNRNWNERFQMHQIDSDYNVLLKNGVPVSTFDDILILSAFHSLRWRFRFSVELFKIEFSPQFWKLRRISHRDHRDNLYNDQRSLFYSFESRLHFKPCPSCSGLLQSVSSQKQLLLGHSSCSYLAWDKLWLVL